MPQGPIPARACLAIGLAFGASAAAWANPPAAAAEKPRTATDPETQREEREVAHRRRHLPEPMPREEIDDIAGRLGLDAPAGVRLAELATEYATTYAGQQAKDGREMLVLLPASFSYDHQSTEIDPVHTPELLRFLQLRERHLTGIVQAEDRFWREFEGIVPVERRDAFRIERLQRMKALHGRPARLPAAGIDLGELLPKAGLSADEIASLALPLAAYRESLERALRKRDRLLNELELRQAEEMVNLGPEWRAGRTDAEALAVDRHLAGYAVATILADGELRDLNQRTVEAIRKQVIPTSARKIAEAYQRLVHPSLFEDERSFRRLVESAIALPLATEDATVAALELLAATDERIRPAGNAAVELADGILAAEGLPPGDAAAARILLETKLQETLAKRRAAIRDAIGRLQTLVPSDQVTLLARIEDARKSLDAQDRAGAFLRAGLAARLGEVEALRALGETPARPIADPDANVQIEATAPDGAPAPTGGSPAKPVSPARGGRGSRGGR